MSQKCHLLSEVFPGHLPKNSNPPLHTHILRVLSSCFIFLLPITTTQHTIYSPIYLIECLSLLLELKLHVGPLSAVTPGCVPGPWSGFGSTVNTCCLNACRLSVHTREACKKDSERGCKDRSLSSSPQNQPGKEWPVSHAPAKASRVQTVRSQKVSTLCDLVCFQTFVLLSFH